MNSPGQLYNMDKSGIPLDSCPPNVIAKQRQKKFEETGRARLGAVCIGTWTHEDYIDDSVIDINGKEQFCPACLV